MLSWFVTLESWRYYLIQFQYDCTTFQHWSELCPEAPVGWCINDLLCNKNVSLLISQNNLHTDPQGIWWLGSGMGCKNFINWRLRYLQSPGDDTPLSNMDVEYLWNARSWHAILEQFDTLKHALLEKNLFYTALTRQVIGKLKKNLIIRNRLLYKWGNLPWNICGRKSSKPVVLLLF